MPYVDVTARRALDARKRPARSSGELNYQITALCVKYIKDKGENYTTLNEVHGVLTCAGLELYRRRTAPYEDARKAENGDVYGL